MRKICPLIIAAILAACASVNLWQDRADALQGQLSHLVKLGAKTKDDFLRQYGIPSKCEPLSSGELCEWRVPIGASTESHGNAFAFPVGRTAIASGSNESFSTAVAQLIRIEFDKQANLVKGQAFVRNGGQEFIGQYQFPEDRYAGLIHLDEVNARNAYECLSQPAKQELIDYVTRSKTTPGIIQPNIKKDLSSAERNFVAFILFEGYSYQCAR